MTPIIAIVKYMTPQCAWNGKISQAADNLIYKYLC